MDSEFKVKKTVKESETKTTITFDFTRETTDSSTISGTVEEVVAELQERANNE